MAYPVHICRRKSHYPRADRGKRVCRYPLMLYPAAFRPALEQTLTYMTTSGSPQRESLSGSIIQFLKCILIVLEEIQNIFASCAL